MPQKSRKNTDVQPESSRGEAEELREESVDPVDVLMHELGAAGGTARVIVRKIAPLSEQGYIGEWSPADFSLGVLAEVGGPGKYAAQVRDAGGRYLRQVTLDVSPRVRRVGATGSGGAGAWTPSPAAPAVPSAPAAPATPAPSLTDTLLVTLMQQQGEMLRAMASRPTQPDAGLALLGSIVPAMMRDRSGPDTLLRAVEVVDRLRGDVEPDAPASPEASEMRIVERIIERVGAMLERRTSARTAPEKASGPALETTTTPAPPSTNTPPASPEAPKPAQLPALVVLIAAAADDGKVRPVSVAQAVLDSIGLDTARKYRDLPEGALAGEVVNLIPRLDARRAYLVEIETALRALVRDAEQEGESDAE